MKKYIFLLIAVLMFLPNKACAFIVLDDVQVFHAPNALNFTINYTSSNGIGYNPLMIGGMAIQSFFDVDINSNTPGNPYPYGAEYAISSWRSDDNGQTFQFSPDSLYVRDIRNSFYGPVTGTISIINNPGSLFFSMPLSYIGNDDGTLRYNMGFYETVSCPNCVGGISHALRYSQGGTVAPEPSTMLLVGIGLVGTFLRKKFI